MDWNEKITSLTNYLQKIRRVVCIWTRPRGQFSHEKVHWHVKLFIIVCWWYVICKTPLKVTNVQKEEGEEEGGSYIMYCTDVRGRNSGIESWFGRTRQEGRKLEGRSKTTLVIIFIQAWSREMHYACSIKPNHSFVFYWTDPGCAQGGLFVLVVVP